MTETLALSSPSSSVKAARSVAGSNDDGEVRAGVRAPVNGAGSPEQGVRKSVGVHTDRPERAGVLRIAVPSTSARIARLNALVREREPSLDQLLNERDPWPELYSPLTEYTAERISRLVYKREHGR